MNKNKIKPKIETDPKNRTPLETVIPLNTPFVIVIEPSDKCNFKCNFCPTGDVELMKNTRGRHYGNMNFELFKKIVDDISGFKNDIKALRLYEHGEPLLNPELPNMIKYAKDSKKFNHIEFTTNAFLLKNELSLKIINSGLDQICISIEGINEQQYKEISNVSVDFNKLVNDITFFYKNRKQCKVYIKIFGDNLTENEKEIFYNTFYDISDQIFIESFGNIWPDFEFKSIEANKNRGLFNQELVDKNICPFIFYNIAIHSSGEISPCCADWKREIIIGNANTDNIVDVWNGDNLYSLQKEFLENGRTNVNNEVCKNCELVKYEAIDNIDKYRKELLKKYIKQG
ncbi:radical SAM protein [Brachyspira hyodysenteriae]|uniref:radical SAM/SPASM domain-containing protein n=1 Tax=Brachyspira hyodysenteriae TaxID=159 RepID=UPI0022CD2BBB|nr:radical SAM/SPASM domain-containing protein [Brachyspira hyodysenteriae]MCZ9840557.1 radical SAM protein [Brachyspira hyodysenteriae]MCZ9849582.1 radical SAM protein [Brachyspira hyodysenteriae]MCZ9874321.1 radical SAM protein [Brachyspira hyodysenteriae]MCZ9931914.1 radical SAM protein [Brachyspira hyodysenteriae]